MPERGEEPSSRHRAGWGIAGLALGAGAGAAAGAAGLIAVAWLLGMPLGRDDRTTEAARRVAALEARVNEIAARPPPAADPRVGETATRVAAIEQTLAQFKALETRVAQAEAALKTVRSSGDSGLTERVAALDKAAKSLASTVADLRRRVDEAATVAQAAREAAAQSSGASAAVAETANAVTTLGQRVAALESATKAMQTTLANSSTPDRDRRARLATTVIALRAAVESGAPYATEFAAAKALGADAPRLAALEPFEVSGVPSVAVLARELDAIILATRKAAEPNRNGGGFFGWLQTSFERLVRVRPADGSRSPAAGAGRVQALLARGEIAQAIAAAEALPEAERAPLQAWIDKAKKRAAALNAARDLAHDGVAALVSSNGEPAAR
jgi:hypothetical protein